MNEIKKADLAFGEKGEFDIEAELCKYFRGVKKKKVKKINQLYLYKKGACLTLTWKYYHGNCHLELDTEF